MRIVPKFLPFGGAVLSLVATAAFFPMQAHSARSDGISLLQTLSEWKYPGSEHLVGPSMSDAGTPPMQAAKCEAILTTPDPVAKVVDFYTEKLKKDPANTISIQDDSKGRQLALRVIVVNRIDTTTTLVISRAQAEEETHIVWSHTIRFSLADHGAEEADARVRISLSLYSGREDPDWETSVEEIKNFASKFDLMKARQAQIPLNSALGYRGFLVHGFRSYDRVWIWKGTAEATRDGKTFQWSDNDRALEKYLLEISKEHVSDREFKLAVSEVGKK